MKKMNGFSLGFLVLEAVPGETWASAMRQDRCSRSRASARQRAPLHLRSLTRAVCGSLPGGPEMTRTVGLNRHGSQLNSLLATFYMNLSLQKQTHLVDGRPQVSSNGTVPCFCGSKPQLFEWLRAGRAREGLCLDRVLLRKAVSFSSGPGGTLVVPH